MERTHQFPSLSLQTQSRGTHAQRIQCGPQASSPGGEITAKRPAGVWGAHDLELVEITIQINPHIFYIQGFRNRRKQLHSEKLIKNPSQYTNRKYYLLTGLSVNGHKETVLCFQTD